MRGLMRLESRDCPTAFLPAFEPGFPGDLRPPVEAALHTASVALDVPGVTVYPVSVEYDPRTLVLGYATNWPGEARGAIWLGAAVRAYDVESVVLHEAGHAAGSPEHSPDRRDVMYMGISPDEVKRAYTAGDRALFRAAGLVAPEPEPEPEPPEVYPYTEQAPYLGPLVRVASPWGPGWAHVPPRVAEQWGLTPLNTGS